MRIVITGANRGIGLELVRQYLSRGESVEATARSPRKASELQALQAQGGERLRIHPCEVTDPASVAHLAEALAPGGVDLLINNAGVGGGRGPLEQLDLGQVVRIYEVNAVGPLRVTAALLPLLRKARGRVVHVTSRMGSIADNTSGDAYGYRMSKAALNMACKSMALDLAADGIATLVVNPGWVQTDMGGPQAPTKVEESAANLIRLIDTLGPERSGRFFNHTGEEIPW
jgi:NAD(P)-dependent dehydrogenase (short-subunit alcohol dehydrogenase family)